MRISKGSANNFNNIREIKDEEYVEQNVTNRPINDVLSNAELLAYGIDMHSVNNSLGAYNPSQTYQMGDIVSYGDTFYVSTINENRGNTPEVVPDRGEWNPISKSDARIALSQKRGASVLAEERIDGATTTVSSLPAYGNAPQILHNGKYLNSFTLTAKKIYSLIRFSRFMPYKGEYTLKITHNSGNGDNDWPGVSYVNFEILHNGFEYNTSGVLVPMVLIKECYCQNAKSEYIDKNNPRYWDRFGPYGLSIMSVINFDGSVSINIATKYNTTIEVSGKYDIEPTFDLVEYNTVAYYVNHLVRPFGGDLAQNVGSLVPYDGSLTRKQVWDRGLLWRFQDLIIGSDVYSLFFLAKGYKLNFGKSITGTRPSDITSQNNNTTNQSLLLRSVANRVLRGVGDLTEGIGEWQEDGIANATGYVFAGDDNGVNNIETTSCDGMFLTPPIRTMVTATNNQRTTTRTYGIYTDISRCNRQFGANPKEVCVKNMGVEFFSQTH